MSNKLTKKVKEGSVEITISKEKKISRKLPVFYNPLMESNRNISIILLNSVPNRDMKIALPLAGTGVRGLRFLKELKKGKLKELFMNDINEDFFSIIKQNLEMNSLGSKNLFLHNEDATLFMLKQQGFDYIELDVFGSPNDFLYAAVKKISRQGIIAVTATDTAALTGTYLKSTKRKYWAISLKNYLMHETGLRILIRKVQLLGVQFDKALIPILSYHKDHYFRIYFRSIKSKEKCDEIIRHHQYFLYCPKCLNLKVSNYNRERCKYKNQFLFAGPLWTGKLFDQKLVTKMAKTNPFPEEQKFLDLLKEEARVDVVGFRDLHVMAKKQKKEPPKMDVVLKKLKGVRTHFSLTGIKSKK